MSTITYQFGVDWDGNNVVGGGAEDNSADLLSFRISRGFPNRQARVAAVGRAEFVLHNPISAYTPFVTANALPMRRVEFNMVIGSFGNIAYKGWIESIEPTSQWGAGTCTIKCVDLLYKLQTKKVRLPVQFYQRADQLIESAIVAAGFASHKGVVNHQALGTIQISADRWENEYDQQLFRRMPFVFRGAFSEASVSDIIRSAATADWGRFFIDGNGEWRFYNRHHHAFGASTDWTVYDSPPGVAPAMFVTRANQRASATTVINDVKVQVNPRTIGTVGEVLARISPGSPISIEPSTTRTITLSYRDPSGQPGQVGGYDVIPPTNGTGDVYATFERTGDGADASSYATVISDISGTAAKLEITNASTTQVLWIHKLQVRGKAIRVRERLEMRTQDTTSQTTYDRRELTVQSSMISSEQEAQRLADFLVMQYKDPQQEIPAFTVNAFSGDDMATLVRDIELLDGVTLSHSRAGISSDFTVLGITHDGSRERGHVMSLVLEPYPIYRDGSGNTIIQPFRIGSPINNSAYDMVY